MNSRFFRERVGDVDQLIDLEPEELGAIIVEAIRRGQDARQSVGHAISAVCGDFGDEFDGFPRNRRHEMETAILEAWAWLEAQGLLIWSDTTNGPNGFRKLSRRGQRLQIEDFSDFRAARQLPRDVIHSAIRDRVWSDFVRGHYDSAVFYAARQVEIAVRGAANADDNVIGVSLMRHAFHPKHGPLSDPAAIPAEREARMHLFAGFIGGYKNAVSHRDISLDDPKEAMEIILLASHLLRIVEARVC